MCISPLTLKSDTASKSTGMLTRIVPCGKCFSCIARRRKAWTFRLTQHIKQAETVAFVTFTYDDKNLPWKNGAPSLRKKDLQTAIKAIREQSWWHWNPLGRQKVYNDLGLDHVKTSYYACGEYGGETHRPHYHAIMYNLPKKWTLNNYEQPELTGIWKKGRVQTDTVNSKTIAYVAGYVNKKIQQELTVFDEETGEIIEREKEFSVMSKGIGKNFLTDKMVRYLQENKKQYVKIDGYNMGLPRYFKEAIFDKEQRSLFSLEAEKYREEKLDDTEYGHQQISETKNYLIKQHLKKSKKRNRI